MNLGLFSALTFFWNIKRGVNSLNDWCDSPAKPSGPGFLFPRSFLITTSISLVVNCLLRFSYSSWFSLEDCVFSGIYSFCPDVQFVGIQLFVTFSYSLLYLFDISCYFPCFISNFIWVLSFLFWMSLVKGSSILFIFSMKQLLDSFIL